MVKAKNKIEHHLYQLIKKYQISDKVLVAVSGGQDSMALLRALLQVMDKKKVVVCHFHHGNFKNKKFRNQAEALVRHTAETLGLALELRKSLKKLTTEKEFRVERDLFFSDMAKKHNTSIVIFAHHLNDWLETQFIKLIRGCSFNSLNQNLEWSRNHHLIKFRPWIRVKKSAIANYSLVHRLRYVDDPTNRDTKYLRNWIRHKWLKDLEKVRPGAEGALAFSLINSLESSKNKIQSDFPWDFETSSLSRLYFESLDVARKRQCLAHFFYYKKVPEVKRTQIDEIIKRLDKNQNEYRLTFKTFEVIVNAERVSVLQKNAF